MEVQQIFQLHDPQVFGPWIQTHDCDQEGARLADRHYSRQTVGAARFTRPGKNLVLKLPQGNAIWASWYNSPYRKDKRNCYECTIFRNESDYLSSYLIAYACLATFDYFGPIEDGILTYVDEHSVGSKNAGFCFESIGFKRIGRTIKNNLLIYQLTQEDLTGYFSVIQTDRKLKESFGNLLQQALEVAEDDIYESIRIYTKALAIESILLQLYRFARKVLGMSVGLEKKWFCIVPNLMDFLIGIYGDWIPVEEYEHWQENILLESAELKLDHKDLLPFMI
ncbi:hypothetical protein [Cytobacillus oceanisediminis]|uniref:hypothetical protein n=1 Tax=Cytobacillus oceanisediminis TaxID=665099 RepID=UPI001FB4F47F|nr:hypothetical protein [Cytobacillus oceanisediminis]UOE58047.1 hypothetical protein IRB79_27675 [Cytobacillus oceanisediminis]